MLPEKLQYRKPDPKPSLLSSHDSGIIILDEFEKVLHERHVLDASLEIFDKGTTADNRGRKLNCRPFIFILTTNLGGNSSGPMKAEEKTDLLLKAGLRKEFIGRIKLVEVFSRINREIAMDILKDAIEDYNKRPDYYCRFKVEEGAFNYILERADFAAYGVRQIQSTLAEVMNEVLFHNAGIQFQHKTFTIDFSGEEIVVN